MLGAGQLLFVLKKIKQQKIKRNSYDFYYVPEEVQEGFHFVTENRSGSTGWGGVMRRRRLLSRATFLGTCY